MARAQLTPPVDGLPYDDTVSLGEYWRVLVRRRALILGVLGVLAGTALLFTLGQPALYESTATLMPLGTSRSGLPAALGELSGILPVLGTGFGRESPTDRLLAVLQSRTLALDVIQQLDLLPLLFAPQWDAQRQQWRRAPPPTLHDAVRRLTKAATMTASRQGVITLTVEHPDPVLAAAIANRYIAALQQALQDNAFSLAKKNRVFIALQLTHTRQDLEHAEEALKHFEQTHKIVSLEGQTSAAVKAIAFLEEQIMSREVELGVHQRLLKGASREVYLLEEEIRGFRAQLARLQHGAAGAPTPTDPKAAEGQVWIAFDAAPEVKLHYTRLQREAQVQGKLFLLLAQQLEQAKIEEARDETTFQILDRALPPDRKSKPRRALTVALALLMGACVGVFVAFVRDALDTTVHSTAQAERLVGLPVLATLPALARRTPRRGHAPGPAAPTNGAVGVLLDTPRTAAVRALYTRLRYLQGPQPIQTVLLTSAGPDDDLALLLVHLALVAASAGERTLLLDAHLQHATLHRLLHCHPAPGLADMLATPEHWPQGIQPTAVDTLHLVAAGAATSPTPLALATPALDLLLTQYRAAYDLILCLAPALLTSTDAAVLGHRADATCLVVTCGVSRLDTILEAKKALEAVQARVPGLILTACTS